MYLTKLFQVVKVKDLEVFKTAHTQEECEDWLEKQDFRDLMSDLTLTIIPIWTNKSLIDF